MQSGLLFTKFIIPPRRPNLIARDRLTQQLDAALARHHRLALVSARAGSGKTTLVSEWLHGKEVPSSWISLDERDSNPLAFFRYFSQALDRIGIPIESTLLSALGQAPLPDPADLAAEFANAISREESEIILALDDFHAVGDEWIHRALEALIEVLPPRALLILITRKDPSFQLSKLRACDQLTEIRSEDLRFSPREAARFFQETMGVNLDQAAVSALESRTEGWIAGLQLAGISLKESAPDREGADLIQGLAENNQFILEYLADEVLQAQPGPLQDFLLDTSILRIMNGSLCDAVHLSQERAAEGQEILDDLEANNLFIVPLDEDRAWYRYHHLFADLLQETLNQSRSGEYIRELHARAARWHRQQGTPEEAMGHAIAAAEYDLAASLINENFAGLFSRNEVPVFLGWIEKLPEEITRRYPWILLYQAYTYALSGRPDLAEPLLSRVESQIPALGEDDLNLPGHISAIRAYAANLNQEGDRAISLAESVLEDLPPSNSLARGMAAYTLADALIARDNLPGGEEALKVVLRAGEDSNSLLLTVNALCELAQIQTANGKLGLAEGILDQVKDKMDRSGLVVSREICAYKFALANLLRERNELDQALSHAREGIEYRAKLGGYLVIGDLALMKVLQARGQISEALVVLAQAEKSFTSYQYQLAVGSRFRAARITQWLLAGDTAMAGEAALDSGDSELELIARAKLDLARGEMDAVLAFLAAQIPEARQAGRNGRLIEMLLISALAHQLVGNDGEALDQLQGAILLAKPEGYLGVFLDLGTAIRSLLEKYLVRSIAPEGDASPPRSAEAYGYEERLLEAFDQQRSRGLVLPVDRSQPMIKESILTDRELEVLGQLALGFTNKEIASQLVIAPSTVKEHLKNIYDKLDVNNRTQAVQRGKDLGLL